MTPAWTRLARCPLRHPARPDHEPARSDALLAPSAIAAPATGDAYLRLADHDRGRTLSGQDVKIVPAGGGTAEGNMVKLPITAVQTGSGERLRRPRTFGSASSTASGRSHSRTSASTSPPAC